MLLKLQHIIDTHRRTLLVLPWLVVLGVIGGSLLPGSTVAPVFVVSDKIIHLGAYGGMLIFFAPFYEQRYSAYIGLRLVALGVVLECIQGASGLRSFDARDMLANTLGVVIGWVVLRYLYYPHTEVGER